jgi:hypothetical protein
MYIEKMVLDHHTKANPCNISDVNLDVCTQNWGLSRKCKEKELNILKRLKIFLFRH